MSVCVNLIKQSHRFHSCFSHMLHFRQTSQAETIDEREMMRHSSDNESIAIVQYIYYNKMYGSVIYSSCDFQIQCNITIKITQFFISHSSLILCLFKQQPRFSSKDTFCAPLLSKCAGHMSQ